MSSASPDVPVITGIEEHSNDLIAHETTQRCATVIGSPKPRKLLKSVELRSFKNPVSRHKKWSEPLAVNYQTNETLPESPVKSRATMSTKKETQISLPSTRVTSPKFSLSALKKYKDDTLVQRREPSLFASNQDEDVLSLPEIEIKQTEETCSTSPSLFNPKPMTTEQDSTSQPSVMELDQEELPTTTMSSVKIVDPITPKERRSFN